VHLQPDLIFFLVLPPLLFEAAWSISFKEMKRWWRIIGSFAFLVVFFTALSVTVVGHALIPGFTLALGFLLGGIVSPPDAVSTGALTRFVQIPRSTKAILEGESLLNDASSLTIFRFALLAVATGSFVWRDAAMELVWMVLGGAGIGLALGWLVVQLHRRLPLDAPGSIALTLIEPYFMYWAAERLGASGVLAVVCGGLYMSGQRLLFLNSTSRVRGYSVWEGFVFLLNGLVFLLIGLQLPEIVEGVRASGLSLGAAIGYGLLVSAVLVLARIISSYAALVATLVFRPSVAPRLRSPRQRWLVPLVLGWTGMRGVVSLAAALAIPLALPDGSPFPQRSLILFITFVAILLTLVVQGLTLPWVIRRSRVFVRPDEQGGHDALMRLRSDLRRHALNYLRFHARPGGKGELLDRMVARWEQRHAETSTHTLDAAAQERLFAFLESQRSFLEEANRDPEIDEDHVRHELYLIDLEEERLRMKL
jgi:CPA1 family monovalent cation:H+ antiporter